MCVFSIGGKNKHMMSHAPLLRGMIAIVMDGAAMCGDGGGGCIHN